MGVETLLIAGAASGGLSSIFSGNAEADAAERNAAVAQGNAKIAREQAEVQERQYRTDAQKEMGASRAAVGASGVDFGGSASDVLAESAKNAEMNALNIKHQGELKATGFNQESENYKAQAKSSRTMGYLNAAGSVLGGASKLAGMK